MSCLSLGAIDYLIKPLRQNELRHIWTRVWWWRKVRREEPPVPRTPRLFPVLLRFFLWNFPDAPPSSCLLLSTTHLFCVLAEPGACCGRATKRGGARRPALRGLPWPQQRHQDVRGHVKRQQADQVVGLWRVYRHMTPHFHATCPAF